MYKQEKKVKKALSISIITRLLVILIITVLLVAASDVLAQNSKTIMVVSVTVKPSISMRVVTQVRTLDITPEDIEKGYVDVNTGTVLQIRYRGGYLLSFESTGGPFSKIWVIDGSRTTVLSNTVGLIYQPYSGRLINETKTLSYRFFLPADAIPGSYPWPLLMNVDLS